MGNSHVCISKQSVTYLFYLMWLGRWGEVGVVYKDPHQITKNQVSKKTTPLFQISFGHRRKDISSKSCCSVSIAFYSKQEHCCHQQPFKKSPNSLHSKRYQNPPVCGHTITNAGLWYPLQKSYKSPKQNKVHWGSGTTWSSASQSIVIGPLYRKPQKWGYNLNWTLFTWETLPFKNQSAYSFNVVVEHLTCTRHYFRFLFSC